ncbi:Uncharacterized protein TCM_005137 [Theobroma cacao]|uniref:Uncharacterized protein n=1 Tax=Theobroma cacao TaxID=3641 RepID=A0A061DTK6_THECC|nr:Uncharacterized protein TCM_005137 [Theobroma cacao]
MGILFRGECGRRECCPLMKTGPTTHACDPYGISNHSHICRFLTKIPSVEYPRLLTNTYLHVQILTRHISRFRSPPTIMRKSRERLCHSWPVSCELFCSWPWGNGKGRWWVRR